jgi:hypothetical protein
MEFAKPRAATKEDIARVISGFAHAAEYLDKAGNFSLILQINAPMSTVDRSGTGCVSLSRS